MGHVDILLHLPHVIINSMQALCASHFIRRLSSVSYQHVLFEDGLDDRTAVPKVVQSYFLSSLQ